MSFLVFLFLFISTISTLIWCMQQAFLFLHHADRLLLFQVSSRLFSAVLSACSVCRICHYFLFLIKNLIIFLAWSQSNNSTTDLPNGSHLIHFIFSVIITDLKIPLSKFLTSYDISWPKQDIYIRFSRVLIYMHYLK